MATPGDDIPAFLDAQEKRDMLRFVTCGSVDDGKSTLIGRLLWDCKLIFEDQLATLEAESKRIGTQGEDIDFALLLDGLMAEREQGITIDIAYRFFTTDKRKFIVADTPGHEQYTRNMATGASTAEAAVLLVDARHGVLTQTRRHSFIVSLLGIRHVAVVINKMDLLDFDAERFAAVRDDYRAFAEPLGFEDIACIPASALKGDNVMGPSARTPWYDGPTLLAWLESVPTDRRARELPFRMPVQWVNRPDMGFRGFSGTIASGSVGPGDAVVTAGSGHGSTVKRVVAMDGDLDRAEAGQSVTLTLADEIDLARGDMLADAKARPDHADQIEAHVVWMHDEPMIPGRAYGIKIGSASATAQIGVLKHKINVDSMERTAARTLELNEIGVCNLALDRPLSFDAYTANRETGRFILIDRFTNATVGAGMIDFALRRATNVHRQHLSVDKASRAALKGQNPCVLWFTGLSGSGKSTIADAVERRLREAGRHTYLLDCDNLRHGLTKDLGFTQADRVENLRRVGEVAKLFADSGLIVLVSLISPFRSERLTARECVEDGEFLEIFVDVPLSVCEARDPKGLYAKARRGELTNFTGIDSPYEPPESPELVLHGDALSVDEAAAAVIDLLHARGKVR